MNIQQQRMYEVLEWPDQPKRKVRPIPEKVDMPKPSCEEEPDSVS